MAEAFPSKYFASGTLLLCTLIVGCSRGDASADAMDETQHETTATDTSATAAEGSAAGGESAETSSANSGGGGSGGNSVGPVGPPSPPPAPPTDGVPEPSAASASPNLRVLPWAGFGSAITYTFDDTQPSQVEHWPELEATAAALTFFANPSGSSQAGYDAHWSAVAASGSEIGNHTWSHCHADLSGCTPVGTAEDEIDQATSHIISNLGVAAVYSFAAPFGEVAWNSTAASRFLIGRGVLSGLVPPSGQSDWYNLPCIPVNAGQTATEFNAAVDNARAQGRWGIFLFHSILPTANNWYAGVEIADITANIAYTQAFGDVWIDTMAEIGAYVRAQQLLEGLTPNENEWTWTLPEHFPPGKVLRVVVDGGSLSQAGTQLSWDAHGYYEVALDAGTLSWQP